MSAVLSNPGTIYLKPKIHKTSSFAPCLSVILGLCLSQGVVRAQQVDFSEHVRPILSEKCFHCHGPDAAARQADLRLDQAEAAAAVLTIDAKGSNQLLERISSADPDIRMPPADSPKQLSDAEIQTLRQWVSEGASYSGHWAFKAVETPVIPTTTAAATPVDAFVITRRHKQPGPVGQLASAPPADPCQLARRVSLDLNGIPLAPDQLASFLTAVEDIGLDRAYEQLIDHLMASPRYGEHMALPWLEAARFADTDGYQNDRYRYQSAWRDWVIRAYNWNMPYDQFVIEQLAGDLLPDATLWQQVASGFGRNHRINSEDGSIPEEWLTENVADRVDTLGTVFLGMTIGCARCHDHKYDPISQQDYYRLFAYFNSIAEHGVGPNNGNSPPFVELPTSWPLISADQDHAIEPDPVKLRPAREATGNGLLRPQAGSPNTVMVMHELPEPRQTYVLTRGVYDMPDKTQPVQPGVPSALNNGDEDGIGPKNRLELADWLVRPENPLTARVAVNRIWQQFFGLGIVETSENFGSQGTAPSHPHLLDWLASELTRSGWNIRHVQKQILLSSTYRQSSAVTANQRRLDPKNRWLARGPRQRVAPFVLRDQALAAAGLLAEKIGGPSVKPYMPPDIWSSISNNKYEQDTGESLFRRSLYTYWRRTIPPPTMMNFNAAAREVCTVRTETTNTPLQALTLMNNVTFIEAAKKLAERLTLESHSQSASFQPSAESLVAAAFTACATRPPSEQELDVLMQAHASFLEAFDRDPDSASKLLAIGEAPFDDSLQAPALAALTMTTSLILNLDEVINKE